MSLNWASVQPQEKETEEQREKESEGWSKAQFLSVGKQLTRKQKHSTAIGAQTKRARGGGGGWFNGPAVAFLPPELQIENLFFTDIICNRSEMSNKAGCES